MTHLPAWLTRPWLRSTLWWLLVAPSTGWALLRVSGVEPGWVGVQLLSFTPYVAALSVLPVVAAAAVKRWPQAIVAGVALLVLAACVLPRTMGSADRQALPAGTTTVRIMSVNMRAGGADPATIVRLVRDRQVDVLAVQEFTPQAEQALAEHSLSTVLPYSYTYPIQGFQGSALFSRHPLSDTETRLNPDGFGQVSAAVRVPDGPDVWVESVHPTPPLNHYIQSWHDGLLDQQPATVDGPLRVLVGDFNATLDHAPLRQLIATGYRDAASVVGAGLTPTWPYAGPRQATTPKIAIDHLLADRRIRVLDFDAITVDNTDHRAIISTLRLP